MTSEPTQAYVWIWLPDESDPVVAGRVDRGDDRYRFRYGQSYLGRPNAVAIYSPELPLDNRVHDSLDGAMPLCLDDAAPDSWGRAVINAKLGAVGTELEPLTYLLESGSDRVGAIDFQMSATQYVPRAPVPAPIDQLIHASDIIAAGGRLDPDLAEALVNGTPLGGARPKALVEHGGVPMLAKLSLSSDTFLWVQSEYVAMELAHRCGIDASPVHYLESGGRSVLLVERFDRPAGHRRRVVSAATILGMQTIVAARHFTYVELADEIRSRFVEPDATLHQLFERIMFNILMGNTDDHARNHAAFVVGDEQLELTPAYDVAPQPRLGETARHPRFGDGGNSRDSRIAELVAAAAIYHLSEQEAQEIADRQVATIRQNWSEVCDAAHLTGDQRASLLEGPILNRSVFYD